IPGRMSEFDPNAAATSDSGIYGLPFTPEESSVILIPVPWEVTTSYRTGTARGPRAILEASKQVDLYDVETGMPYQAGLSLLDEPLEVRAWNAEGRALAEGVIEAGGDVAGRPELERALAQVNELSARLNEWVRRQADKWLDA